MMENKSDEESENARESIIYDDVTSEGKLSKESFTGTKDASQEADSSECKGAGLNGYDQKALESETRQSGKKEKTGYSNAGKMDAQPRKEPEQDISHSKAVKESFEDQRRKIRKDSNDKELWTPVKSELKDSKGDEGKSETEVVQELHDDKPSKPPRRPPQKKPNHVKEDVGERGECEQEGSPLHSPDPVKPPRRRLPQPPTQHVEQDTVISGTLPSEGNVTASDLLSGTDDGLGQKPRDIVCKPVLTSSPNQEVIPSLTVERIDALDTSRRTLSYIDVSSGKGKTTRVESFYDFLYSRDDSVANVTSPVLNDGDRAGSVSRFEEHPYDAVHAEDSITDTISEKSYTGSTYEEVIVNQEAYVMPSLHDDESDEFSDGTDPWGSDFETEDDMTDVGSLTTSQPGDFKDEEEEDPYDSVEISPMTERKRPFRFVSEITNFSPFKRPSGSLGVTGLKGQLKGCLGLNKASSQPYLPSTKTQKGDETDGVYVDPDITDSVNYQQPVMPPMPSGLSTDQIKRYQIVKFMLESEGDYMKLLDQLSKQYELPIRERDLLEPNKIDIIFQHVQLVLQCHAMFNIALSARMADWTPDDMIGDILYALFCKSMVLDAYSGYVNNFSKAMDTVKLACRTHLAFAQFLKSRRQSSSNSISLHHLMLKPIQRFPQILALLQELLLVTPKDHPDRVPLQLALTQLECLAENLRERKREAELRNKVKLLDGLIAQNHKSLMSGNRYFVRQDDFVQCTVEGESILGTKKRRIIMLSDMLLCVSLIKGKKDRAMHMVIDPKAKYKLKWNVPLNDVDIIEYGPGVNILTNSYRTTISHSKEGQYRKAYSGCREHFEDLQQDLAVIGQIAGLVSTLRRSYRVLDVESVQKWHKAVQRTIEEETRLANLYWLELSLPSKHGHVNCIFSTDSPAVKAEWVTTLNTSKLRLSPQNNPGWYLPEDDGTGGVAIQRRNMPLLKDNTSLFVLSQKTKVHNIVSVPDMSDTLPGVRDNYDILWLLCGGGDHAGHVTVVKVSLASPPQVVESFHVSDSIIMCGEYVERTCGEEKKFKGPITGRFGFPFPTVWLGTQGGRIFIYNAMDATRRYVMSVRLPDAVLAIKTVNMKIFATVADGSLVIFKQNQEGTWNFSEPKAVALGKDPVMAIAVVSENLWCSCGNKLFIISHDEEVIKHVIEVDDNPKSSIKHLVSYGVGVWVSIWKVPSIKLFHSETLKHVQDISIASPVTNMQRDIDSQLEKTKLDQVYVTALSADEGLLWVGTSVGVTLLFPLPRLEGVPLVSGKACVAFHSYGNSVRCFYPLKNNPSLGTGHGLVATRQDLSLFREHEVRDACVQTDPGISGAWGYASRGPTLANQASPKKITFSKTATPPRQISNQVGEGEEDYSDEDVHSDDEFNFVEDKQQTLNGMRISSVAGTGTGTFSVKFEGCEEAAHSPTSIASSVQSGEFIGKSQFRVDDFARMLSEFKGFGTSPPNPSIPEPPRIPLVITNTSIDEVDGTPDENPEIRTGTTTTNGETTGSVGEADRQALAIGDETGDFRGRVKSAGEYIKLSQSRAAAAQALAINENDEAESKREVESRPETKSDIGKQLTVTEPGIPNYVQIFDDSQPSSVSLEGERSPEKIYDSPRQDDSYTVFERSQRHASKLAGKKVENLKPRLPFPVLLVSAGEGYADLRRKKRSENDKEPRIMIWQVC